MIKKEIYSVSFIYIITTIPAIVFIESNNFNLGSVKGIINKVEE